MQRLLYDDAERLLKIMLEEQSRILRLTSKDRSMRTTS